MNGFIPKGLFRGGEIEPGTFHARTQRKPIVESDSEIPHVDKRGLPPEAHNASEAIRAGITILRPIVC